MTRLVIAIIAGGMILVAMGLAGCATAPCLPNACTIGQAYDQDRDPFPVGAISYGTIFGEQPEPGKITVEPQK